MPLALVFWTFGDRIFNLWVPSIAKYSAPLLPILLSGYMIAVVAQFSSGMLLQGLGRHQIFARGLLVESIAVLAGLIFVLPRYGIIGGAYVISLCMVANRGLFAPWLVSREMRLSFPWFMHSIYTWPVVTAIPVALLATVLRFSILPGKTWFQLLEVSSFVTTLYFALAIFICLPASHRSKLTSMVVQRLPLRLARAA